MKKTVGFLLVAILMAVLVILFPTVAKEASAKEEDELFGITYQAHVQREGWQPIMKDGETAGTIGKGYRMEALRIALVNSELAGDVEYRTHIQGIGWESEWKKNGEDSGTVGSSKRLEAIQIRLTGELADNYDVYYSVHAQGFGWLAWAKNGEKAGTSGYSYRLEAIQVLLVEKGGETPKQLGGESKAYVYPLLQYRTHVQRIGWQPYMKQGESAGTTGLSYRLEAINIKVNNEDYSGDIEYRTHIQGIGWESEWKKNGEDSGTVGSSKRLEAIQIRLTGELAEKYDIYYAVHAQKFGWLGWAKNGEQSGTAGYSYRLEAIRIVLVEKGGDAPQRIGNINDTVKTALVRYQARVEQDGWLPSVPDGVMGGTAGRSLKLEALNVRLQNQKYAGDIEYRSHVQGTGWESTWKRNGENTGVAEGGKRLEAIQMRLTGEMAEKYDVYYRVHIQRFGWSGWAKNGEAAGSSGYSYRLEAIEIRIVEKDSPAPGSTMYRYYPKTSGYLPVGDRAGKTTISDFTEEPFSVFMTGCDGFGQITETAHCDANILMCVNPKTHKVLMVNIPRDSYIPNPAGDGALDRFTLIGLYGMDTYTESVEGKFGVNINRFIKMSFSGFSHFIDAIGGITVESELAFTTVKQATAYNTKEVFSFVKGKNECDGAKALAFCRERHAFDDLGINTDSRRSRDQALMMQAILNKMLEKSNAELLSSVPEFCDGLEDELMTSFSEDEIKSIIRKQLDEGAKWDIEIFSLDGKLRIAKKYTNPTTEGYVLFLDDELVETAKSKIRETLSE